MIQIILVCYIVIVCGLSLMPSASIPSGFQVDKYSHFIAYVLLGVLAYLSANTPRRRLYLFILGFFTGLILELLQFFVPGRYPGFLDLLANTLGLSVAYVACGLLIEKLLKSTDPGRKMLDSIFSRFA